MSCIRIQRHIIGNVFIQRLQTSLNYCHVFYVFKLFILFERFYISDYRLNAWWLKRTAVAQTYKTSGLSSGGHGMT